jgi:prepilin-type N-terminal cleavage/methylation domain-containing protein
VVLNASFRVEIRVKNRETKQKEQPSSETDINGGKTMKRIRQIHGFTLMEMLMAMAIVAVMIGLLIPAISKIQTMALVVKQRSQFNAIGVALEAFYLDSGRQDYPPSSYTDINGDEKGLTSISNGYTGMQKLAEALIGMDGFGFHPQSQWRYDGLQDTDGNGTGDVPLYYSAAGFNMLSPEKQAENIASCKGPYLEMEKANAVKLSSIYSSSNSDAFPRTTYALTDMFRKRSVNTGQVNGMPILYFRADTTKTWSSSDAQGTPTNPLDCIYNFYNNNYAMTAVPWVANTTQPMRDHPAIFYQRIKNPSFPGTAASSYKDARPYRADSFILLSAGPDGLYGTADDIYNFDENNK